MKRKLALVVAFVFTFVSLTCVMYKLKTLDNAILPATQEIEELLFVSNKDMDKENKYKERLYKKIRPYRRR